MAEVILVFAIVAIIFEPFVHLFSYPWNWVAGIVAAAAGILGVAFEYKEDKKAKTRAREAEVSLFKGVLNTMLSVILKSVRIFQGHIDTNTLRINIMILENGELRIYDQIGMSNSAEIALKYTLGQGCCGYCAEVGVPATADLDQYYFQTYEETCTNNGNASPWGISREHFDLTRDIKSILSYPIKDPQNGDKVIAVLNLDDKINLANSQFLNNNVIELLENFAPKCAQYLLLSKEGSTRWQWLSTLQSVSGH